MIPEDPNLRETMPLNPRLQGTAELDELCRSLRALIVLGDNEELLDERFVHVPPAFDPDLLSHTQRQQLSMMAVDDESLGFSGLPGSVIDADTERMLRRRRVEEERHLALEAAELELRQSGDLSETPREYPIKGRTVDWVRSFYEAPPEDPQQHEVTQSTTSPVHLGLFHGYDPEEYEASVKQENEPSDVSTAGVQYMSHNRRWCLRGESAVLPTVERENSLNIEHSDEGEIKEEIDDSAWEQDMHADIKDEDKNRNDDVDKAPSDGRAARSSRLYHTSAAPSPPATREDGLGELQKRRRGRPARCESQTATATSKTKSSTRNNKKATKGDQHKPKSKKRQRSNGDDGKSEHENEGSKRKRPLRRSNRLAGKAASI